MDSKSRKRKFEQLITQKKIPFDVLCEIISTMMFDKNNLPKFEDYILILANQSTLEKARQCVITRYNKLFGSDVATTFDVKRNLCEDIKTWIEPEFKKYPDPEFKQLIQKLEVVRYCAYSEEMLEWIMRMGFQLTQTLRDARDSHPESSISMIPFYQYLHEQWDMRNIHLDDDKILEYAFLNNDIPLLEYLRTEFKLTSEDILELPASIMVMYPQIKQWLKDHFGLVTKPG